MQENISHQVAAILRGRYCSPEYSQLKQLLYEETFPLNESFINLALVKEEEQKPKDQVMKTETNLFRDQLLQNFETIHQPKESIALLDIFTKQKDDKSSTQHLLIEGRAGVGKSTLCQYIANQWAEEQGKLASWRQHFTWVIWMPLRELTEDNNLDFAQFTLAQYIHKKYLTRKERRQITVDTLVEELDKLIKQKQVLLLLDGYDEIAEWLNSHKPHKEFFEDEVLTCSYWLLTSRPYYISKSTLQADRRLEVVGFVNENIPKYVQQFFKGVEAKKQQSQIAKANSLIQFLRNNPSVWGMSHIPINLELICSVWEEEGEISKQNLTLTQLYNQLVLYIFKRYLNKSSKATIKNLSWHDVENDENLHCRPMLAFLELLAWQGMQQNSLILSGKNIIELAKIFYPTDHQQREKLGEAVLKELGLLKGIGIARDSVLAQDYYFVHLTFQEYWAARYIVSCWKKNISPQGYQNIKALIATKKFDPRYEIVWWMVAGLLSNEPEKLKLFFTFLEEEPKDLTGVNLALLQMRCLEECQGYLDKQHKDRVLACLVRWIDNELTYPRFDFFTNYLALSPRLLKEDAIQGLIKSSLSDKRNKQKIFSATMILKKQTDIPFAQVQQVISLLKEPADKGIWSFAVRIEQAENQRLLKALVQQVLLLSLKNPEIGYDAIKISSKLKNLKTLPFDVLQVLEEKTNTPYLSIIINNLLLEALIFSLKNLRDKDQFFPFFRLLLLNCLKQRLPLYFVDNKLFIRQESLGIFTLAQKCQFINHCYEAFYAITGMLPELSTQEYESFRSYLMGQMLSQSHTLFQWANGQAPINELNKQGYIGIINAILSYSLAAQFLDKELQTKIINYAAERKPLMFQHKKVEFLRYFGMTSQLQGDKTMEAKSPADKQVIEKVLVKREEIILDVYGIAQAITALIDDMSLQKILTDLLKEAHEKQKKFNQSSLKDQAFCQLRDAFISKIKSTMQKVSQGEKYTSDEKDVALTQIFPDILFPFWRCRPYQKIETAKEAEQNQEKEQQLFLQQQQLRSQPAFSEVLIKINTDRASKITTSPKIYFMYAWPLEEYQSRENGVQPFLQGLYDDLTAAGIEVIFDKEDNFSGNNLNQFMGQILDDIDYVIIFGTESFRHKWFGEKTALQFEGKLLHLRWLTDLGDNKIVANLKATIIPWVLTGIRETAIPEDILPAKNTTVRALYKKNYIMVLSNILSIAYSLNIKTIETYFSQIMVTQVESKQRLTTVNQASLDTIRASENHEHKGIEPLPEQPSLKGAVAMLEANTNVQVQPMEKKLPLLDKALIANKTPVELYRYLASQGYTWRYLLNTHVFDLNLTAETRKASEAIVKELITKRDILDKDLYLASVQRLLGDENKASDEQRYFYNRVPKNTGPRNDLTGYKLEYYVLDILDKQQNDKRVFTVSIIAPGSRDLTSDIDTTVEVTCHQKAIVLPLNLPKEFGEISLSEMDIELVIQAGIVYHFNQLNCEKLGQTSAESRDSNVYIDGFMHALAFPKFDDFVWQDEKQQEKSGIQLVTNKSKKAFYQAQKHQRNVLELAASLLPLRAYYQKDDKEFTKQLKALFAVNSLDKSNQASFDKLMQEVIKKTNDLYQYQQTQIHTFKIDEAIQAQYVTRCSKDLDIALLPESLTHERAEDFEAYVNNVLYAKHIMDVAKVRQQLKAMAKALSDEKNTLVSLQAELQKFDKSIQNGKKKIEQATDEDDKEAFELKLSQDQTKRTNCYKDKFLPQLKTYVANLEAFTNLQIQQQEALINAQLFALEAYTNYSAPYHIVKWLQSGDDSVRIDRRRVALCSALQQMGFQLLHAQHYQALGMEPGQILYRVAKYGQRVADVFFGDNQWFGDQEHAYHDSDKVLQRFKSEVLAKIFGEQLYDLLNLQIALVKDIKKSADIPVHEKGHQAMLLCLKRYMKEYKNSSVDGLSQKILDTVLAEEKDGLDDWLKVKDTVLVHAMGKLIVEAYRAKIHRYPEASGKQLCWGTLFNATGSNVQLVSASDDTHKQSAVKIV